MRAGIRAPGGGHRQAGRVSSIAGLEGQLLLTRGNAIGYVHAKALDQTSTCERQCRNRSREKIFVRFFRLALGNQRAEQEGNLCLLR